MARKKEETPKPAPKKGSPSVTTFLSKISTPKGARDGGPANEGRRTSPAKDLLGGITRDDLANVGMGDLAEAAPAVRAHLRPGTPANEPALPLEETEELRIELMAQADPPGRKVERIGWQGVVDVRGVFAGPIAGADGAPRAKDVSLGGVFVETAHLLEVGDPVVLSFPGDAGAGDADGSAGGAGAGSRLVVSGRVRWVTPFGRVEDPTPGMGIEFVGLDKAKRDKLERLLSKARSN